MEIQIRAVIHFLSLKRSRNPDIISKHEDVSGQGVTTLITVERWTKASTEECISLNDSPSHGQPLRYDVTNAVKQMMDDDRFCAQNRIAQRLTMHRDVVKRMLTQELGLRKRNFQWIALTLTTDQKVARVTISRQLLMFRVRCSEQQLCDIFRGDETWIYADNPRSSV
jgi:hypothetical protein